MTFSKITHPCIFILMILISTIYYSCSKDYNPPEQTPRVIVEAGEYSNAFNYFEYSPAVDIEVEWDEMNLYGFGSDSLDLDVNGSFDLVFSVNALNEDSLHLINGTPQPFPRFHVDFKNGFEGAITLETIYIGLGQTTEILWVDTLSQGDLIYQDLHWQNHFGVDFCVGSIPQFFISHGPWHSLEAHRFMGVRKGDRYGWIEIDATDWENPKILRAALLK